MKSKIGGVETMHRVSTGDVESLRPMMPGDLSLESLKINERLAEAEEMKKLCAELDVTMEDAHSKPLQTLDRVDPVATKLGDWLETQERLRQATGYGVFKFSSRFLKPMKLAAVAHTKLIATDASHYAPAMQRATDLIRMCDTFHNMAHLGGSGSETSNLTIIARTQIQIAYEIRAVARLTHVERSPDDYSAALVDIRALLESKHQDGHLFEDDKERNHLMTLCVTAMVGSKIQKPPSNFVTERPLFKSTQVTRFHRDFQLDQYVPENFKCAQCFKIPKLTDDGVLKLCPICRQTFYCSKECQVRHRAIHKRVCFPPPRDVLTLNERDPQATRKFKKLVDDDIQEQGFYIHVSPEEGPRPFCRDPITGRLFEAISDADIYFQSDLDADPSLLPCSFGMSREDVVNYERERGLRLP